MHVLDVRKIACAGLLKPGCSFSWQWSRCGEKIVFLGLRTEADRVVLDYRTRSNSDEWQDTQDGAQLVLWADMRTATHQHMSLALQQRRHQIVGDCRQLKMDVDSYNDNRLPVQPIQVIFDFTYDLEELALA